MSLTCRSVQVTRHTPAARHGGRVRGPTVERAKDIDPDAITFAHVSQGRTSSAVDIALS
jgi:hypothetical protein